jgi:hypothetical protein
MAKALEAIGVEVTPRKDCIVPVALADLAATHREVRSRPFARTTVPWRCP